MRTYPNPGAGLARALRLSGLLVWTISCVSVAQAQDRRNLFEVGAAVGYQSFSDVTGLSSAVGGVGRIGVWLPANFSIEAEGSISSSEEIGVGTGTVSALYNIPLGANSWGYGKVGAGGTRYGTTGPECQQDIK